MKRYSAIRLQPGMDRDSLTASTNENLVLLENYTKLYQSAGKYVFPSVSLAGFTLTTQNVTIPHDMKKIPRFKIFVENDERLDPGNDLADFPDSFMIPVHWGLQFFKGGFSYQYFLGVDEDNLYLYRSIFNNSGSTASTSEENMFYYIFEETVK